VYGPTPLADLSWDRRPRQLEQPTPFADKREKR
jgi:hypothetical protein